MKILKVSSEKLSNRINRIIGSVPLNGKCLSACGSPNKFLRLGR